jgi:hypothetical protein
VQRAAQMVVDETDGEVLKNSDLRGHSSTLICLLS